MNAQTKSLHASSNPQLVGAWTLKSCFMEDVETKERKAAWGERPNGTLILTAGGQWIVVQTSEGRKAPRSDDDRCAAFRSMLAYAGKYRVEGQKILIDVEVAWDESWTGTEQVRFFRIEGDSLHIEAAPQRYASFGNQVLRGILIWERAE